MLFEDRLTSGRLVEVKKEFDDEPCVYHLYTRVDGKTRRRYSPDRLSLKKEPGPDIRIPDSRLKKNLKTRSELLKKPVRNPGRTGFYTDVSRFKTCGTGTYPVRLTSGTGVSQKKEPEP